MHSYHVFFDRKDGVTHEALVAQVDRFMETQVGGNLAKGYRLLRTNNKASFDELPDYQMIVDYASEADLQAAFATMKSRFREDPHRPLMTMVEGFRVAFSHDATTGENPS
ncbi:hypothetical protein HAHE_06640 [Haloferula helveola]|uniref:ABM domain-containing protein n=1 Tax=Haloferula helveola TaxID=490095 RepID=A0ABM7RIC7_9BACT|nr:hypothetical protein HAHE_06640 [Haloferula helveola]